MTVMTGGCQCGRIRYAVRVEDDAAYLCHCRMCQRATGGVAAAFRGARRDDVRWTTRPPDYYRSSPIAHRGYCRDCGTPLSFEFVERSDSLDLTLGSFDDPSRFRPTRHYAAESLHEAWLDTRALPRVRTEDNANVAQRWMDACGKLPD